MASKNKTQVLIGGKIYTMGGYESEEYLQRVAAYLNNKITEIKTAEGYARMSQEMRGLLLNLNTADDYFKLKEKSDQLSESLSAKDKELYEIKHELISTQMKLDSLTRELENEKDAHQEDLREMTHLRTRLQDAQDSMKTAERQMTAVPKPSPAEAKDEVKEADPAAAETAEAAVEETAGADRDPEPVQEQAPRESAEGQPDGQETLPAQTQAEAPAETPATGSAPEKSGSGSKKQKYNRYYRK